MKNSNHQSRTSPALGETLLQHQSRFRFLPFAFLSCLLFSLTARGQFYDFTARGAAEDYLHQVTEKVGESVLEKFPRADALYLAGTLGQIDRLTVSPETFMEHLEGGRKTRNRFYADIPDTAFREYILALRIRSEMTSRAGWRKRLGGELAPLIGDETDVNKVANIVFAWIQGKVKLTGETRTYPLNLKGDLDPLSTLRGGRGSETDTAILAVAALRSAGIGSRIVYAPVIANEKGGKVWVEYRESKAWRAWVPSAPAGVDGKAWLNREFAGEWACILANPPQPVNITNAYVPSVPLWLCPHPLSTEKFDGSAMVVCGGRLQPVMGRDIYNLEPEHAGIGLRAGAYVIVSGDHATLGGIKPVTLSADAPGWYGMDFETKRQEFNQAQTKPAFFEWSPEPATAIESW